MTQKAKRDAARSDLLRLLKGLEFYRDWRISGIKTMKGEVQQEDLNEIVEPSTALLEYFDNAGGQYGQILQFMREWYSHTYSEICYMINTGGDTVSSNNRQFLKDFREEVGFDFQSEAGLVVKIIRKALESGRVASENDYYILKELEVNVDQTFLKGSDLDAISDMLRHFENRL